MVTRLSFCEPTWATPTSRVHIRVLDGAPRPGGGITNAPLCGMDLAGGWDLPGVVTPETARARLDAETGPTCRICSAAAIDLMLLEGR